MISLVNSVCMSGVEGVFTTVETCVSRGIAEFDIIGLAGTSVKESKNRVTAALRNCGFELPRGHITVNLAPSDIKKEGAAFDLAIAAGILAVSGVIDNGKLDKFAVIGELSLEGAVRPQTGAFSLCMCARKHGITDIVIPEANLESVSGLDGIRLWPVARLEELLAVAERKKTPVNGQYRQFPEEGGFTCFSEVKGHRSAKRALEIAASGGHSILMLGAAGSGKTMLAHSLRSVLPPLTPEDIYDITAVYSVAGLLGENTPVIATPPFREVHSGITKAALIGGGRPVVPGEISLAHKGVLFLDEATELERNVTDALRQPMDTGDVNVSRIGHAVRLPADFTLVMCANPCRCGNLFEGRERCTCSPKTVSRTLSKLPRPVLDRIDIHIPVKTPEYSEIRSDNGERSEVIRHRVTAVRALQRERLKALDIKGDKYTRLSPDELDSICELTPGAATLLSLYAAKLSLSIRAYNKIKALSRTIADMNSHGCVTEEDMCEAAGYRAIDRMLYGEGGEADAA